MAKTLGQFAAQSRNLGRNVQKQAEASTKKAAVTVTNAARQRITALSGDGKLSGVGRNGTRVGARFFMQDPTTAMVRATGPLQLVERDTKPHEIRPKRRKRLSIPGVGVRAFANHPGTKGKHPFEKGTNTSLPAVPRIYQQGAAKALRDTFR